MAIIHPYVTPLDPISDVHCSCHDAVFMSLAAVRVLGVKQDIINHTIALRATTKLTDGHRKKKS
jgi:hypothetical protein